MNKSLAGAALVAVTLGALSVPVSAGPGTPTVTITPETVEQGGSVVIANTDDASSTCDNPPVKGSDVPAADGDAQIALEVSAPDQDDLLVGVRLTPDVNGDWSYEIDDLEAVGEYEVFAVCQIEGNTDDAVPSASPTFTYALATFEVIAQQETTTTAAPTTTTTAATAAVTATPHYTG